MPHDGMTHGKCILPTSEKHKPEDSGTKITIPKFTDVIQFDNLYNIMIIN